MAQLFSKITRRMESRRDGAQIHANLKLDYITLSLLYRDMLLYTFDFLCFFFTVLVSEGERCEVIGFIKKGDCLLRRYIDVAHTLPNGKKVSVDVSSFRSVYSL